MTWNTVWITGASTGIGRALALELARGGARVAASARNADALAALSRENPRIAAYPVDVTDRAAMLAAADKIRSDMGPIDLAVLNAGVWQPMGASQFSSEAAAKSMAVNHGGICNGLEAILPAMIARRGGHVALVASVAGYCGLPKAAAYGPTKAAVINLAESLYSDLEMKGIRLQVINPGFVDTPMTEVNTFPMPFLIPVDQAVGHIVRGLNSKKFEIVFPWQMAVMMKLAKRASYPLFFWIARNFLSPASKRGDDAPKTGPKA